MFLKFFIKLLPDYASLHGDNLSLKIDFENPIHVVEVHHHAVLHRQHTAVTRRSLTTRGKRYAVLELAFDISSVLAIQIAHCNLPFYPLRLPRRPIDLARA